jgi:hypothetical protein
MAFPTARDAERAAIAEVVDLIAVDGLPEERHERLAVLRMAARSDTWVPTHCPETGVDLSTVDIVAHAEGLWPSHVPGNLLSAEAKEREAAIFRAAGVKPPARR